MRLPAADKAQAVEVVTSALYEYLRIVHTSATAVHKALEPGGHITPDVRDAVVAGMQLADASDTLNVIKRTIDRRYRALGFCSPSRL